jgi:hypothetical protein
MMKLGKLQRGLFFLFYEKIQENFLKKRLLDYLIPKFAQMLDENILEICSKFSLKLNNNFLNEINHQMHK